MTRSAFEKRTLELSANSINLSKLDESWMSLIYKRKSKGPRIEPCGRPHLTLRCHAVTFNILFVISEVTTHPFKSKTPLYHSVQITWLTVSKALDKCKKMPAQYSLFSADKKISSISWMRAKLVECWDLKPYLCENKILCFSIKSVSLL